MCKTEREKDSDCCTLLSLIRWSHLLGHPQGHYRQIPPREWIRAGEHPETWESNQGETVTGIKGLSILELNSSTVNPKHHSKQHRVALCERDAQRERLTIILNVCLSLACERRLRSFFKKKSARSLHIDSSGTADKSRWESRKLWFSNQSCLLLQSRVSHW